MPSSWRSWRRRLRALTLVARSGRRAGVGVIAPAGPGGSVWSGEQRVDLGLGEVADHGRVEPLLGDREHACDQLCLLGRFQRRVVEERVDRGQTRVAGPHAVAAVGLEMAEERGDRRGVEVLELELRRRLPGLLVHEHQQQSEAVAVCRDRVRAGVALAGETVGEEPLQERRQRGHGCCSQVCSSRSAAIASSSGAASKYQ